jgi:hypothetical protein
MSLLSFMKIKVSLRTRGFLLPYYSINYNMLKISLTIAEVDISITALNATHSPVAQR